MSQAILGFLEEKKDIIDGILQKYFPSTLTLEDLETLFGKPTYAFDQQAVQKVLAEPIWDFLNRGGKRWRPALYLLIAEALGGDTEKLKDFSIMTEFLHNGSIMIDDIEDRGEIRRGKPCTHKLFGIDVAINAGNFMYFLPLLTFLKNKEFSDDVMKRAYDAYAQEMINIHLGQGTDIFWHNNGSSEISEQQYLQMCSFKTGCLARLAARLAVIFAGKDQSVEKIMGHFAESIGIAFQIQDDILSVSGGEFANKKGFGDDITEGKRSLVVIYTLEKANDEDKKRLLEILDMHTTDKAVIEEAISLIKKYGSIERAEKKAVDLLTDAWNNADPHLQESEAKEKLKSLTQFLIERKM